MKSSGIFVASLFLSICASVVRADTTESEFGKTSDGTAIKLFTITNKGGASVQLMTFGASVVTLKVPDRAGKLDDVVLGHDTIDGYLRNSRFFGAIVGRVANRIGGAKFTLDGTEYKLDANDRANTLHGGRKGFDKVVWTGAKTDDPQSVEFTYLSKDGEEGFPGNLTAKVRYTLTDANEFKIEYQATTDKNTFVNLTNHSYFNLAGAGSGDVLNHELTIDADQITPISNQLIPTGELTAVEGTPFDFRTPHKIGERIGADNDQIRFGGGYDMNWVLTKKDGLRLAATVYEPMTGRVMEVLTTQPGLQFYSGNGLSTIAGKNGKTYVRRGALCLEPQHFPDAPNKPQFPSMLLKPGETYQNATVYRFSTRAEK